MDEFDRVLEEVERLDRKATPGPWRHGRESRPCVNPWFERHCDGDLPAEPIESRGTQFVLGVAVGCTDLRSDASLIAHYRTAAPLLAAEVRRLRAGGCARDQRTTQFCAEAVAKDAEIVRLRAELEQARLTLAAEQGRQEGAPSEGWRTDGEVWVKDYPDRTQAGVQPDGLWWRGEWHKPARWHGRANSRRAGMLAADAAAG